MHPPVSICVMFPLLTRRLVRIDCYSCVSFFWQKLCVLLYCLFLRNASLQKAVSTEWRVPMTQSVVTGYGAPQDMIINVLGELLRFWYTIKRARNLFMQLCLIFFIGKC